MTYREAIDRYIKNEECKEFVIHHLGHFSKEKIDDDSTSSPLYQIFHTIQIIYTHSFSGRVKDEILSGQMFYIATNINNHGINYVYEWKSIPEWLSGLSDDAFKEHFMSLYEEIATSSGKENSEAYINFKSHNLSSAITYLFKGAYRILGHDKTTGAVGYGSIRPPGYFNKNIQPKYTFIEEHDREPNAFDDFDGME